MNMVMVVVIGRWFVFVNMVIMVISVMRIVISDGISVWLVSLLLIVLLIVSFVLNSMRISVIVCGE